MSAGAAPGGAGLRLALPGLLWSVTLVVFGLWIDPANRAPATATCLLALAAALGAVHAGVLSAAALALGPRASAGRDLALSIAAGVGYSLLVLSLVKYATVRAHLRFEDLWFLAVSARQVAGEATASELRLLGLAAASPPVLTAAIFALLRSARRAAGAASRSSARRPLLFVLGSLAALVLLISVALPARRLASSIVPETGLIARLFAPASQRAAPGGDRDAAASGARLDEPWRLPPGATRWNVLVVMLESVPWKRAFGPDARPDSTPALRALAGESIVFSRAYATSTHSDYAQTSILASLHPRKGPEHDYFRRLDYPRALFWDPLAANGWRTAVFSCQNERWGNMLAFLSTPGLQLLRHAPDWPEAPHRGEGAESKVFEETPASAFLAWLDAEPGRPFAAYLNFQATHYPYVVPGEWRAPYPRREIDFRTTFLSYPTDKVALMLDRFHNALAYADEQLGRVVEGLRARGQLESTALVVVSDHGEAFYEHGMPTHGTMLVEEQVRTAMLLRLPGHAARTVEQPVSVLDGLPVVWRAAGWTAHGNFQGRDDVLAPHYDGGRRPLPMTIQGMTHEDGLLLGDWKYVVNWDRRGRALFDLANDPDERRDLIADRPEEAARLDRELGRLLALQLGYYRERGWESGRYPPRLP